MHNTCICACPHLAVLTIRASSLESHHIAQLAHARRLIRERACLPSSAMQPRRRTERSSPYNHSPLSTRLLIQVDNFTLPYQHIHPPIWSPLLRPCLPRPRHHRHKRPTTPTNDPPRHRHRGPGSVRWPAWELCLGEIPPTSAEVFQDRRRKPHCTRRLWLLLKTLTPRPVQLPNRQTERRKPTRLKRPRQSNSLTSGHH